MCGIAGILTADRELARRAIAAMNSELVHRGPDDEGVAEFRIGERWLALGNRRLAIIERSELGHQPMVDAETGDALTFNGEVYCLAAPHLRGDLMQAGVGFRGRSDTEALLRFLQLRPLRELARLDGMFAFAFYRAADRTLTLARDAAGIKPLYFAQRGETLLFASETRALLATGLIERGVDRAALAGYLAYGSVQEPRTIYPGIRSLSPGAALTLSLEKPASETKTVFWHPPESRPHTPQDLALEIRTCLQAEVRAHLISDLPIGIFLSSGLDSTLIAAMAAETGARLRTFTVSMAPHDEDPFARQTAQIIGSEHQTVRLGDRDASPWALAWLDTMDQPSMDGMNTYIVSRAAREAGIVVALSGQGGDELFGGYPSFREVPALHRQLNAVTWVPRPMRRLAARMAATGRHNVARWKALDLADSDGGLINVYFHRRRLMSNQQMRQLGFRECAEGLSPNFIPIDGIPAISCDDPIAAVARLEFATYLRSTLLRDSDAASMAVSLELRVPFLSRPLLDLMLSIPGDLLLPPGRPLKHMERFAFADMLRPQLLNRPKHGFNLPIASWMLGSLRDACHAACERLKRMAIIDPEGVDNVWQAFEREPRSPAWSRAWALVALGRYLERHREPHLSPRLPESVRATGPTESELGPVPRSTIAGRAVTRVVVGANSFKAGNGGIARVARLMAQVFAQENRSGRLGVQAIALSDADGCGLPIRTERGSRARFVLDIQSAALRTHAFVYDFLGTARAHCRLPMLDRPMMLWIHGVDVWEGARRDRIMWSRRTDMMLSNTMYTRDRADRLHGGFSRARVCWLATEQDEPAARPAPQGPPTLLTVGRMDESRFKGHDELIGAWPIVLRAVPHAELLIVGTGADMPRLQSRASRLPPIQFLGFVAEREMEAVWRRATAFAMPSRGEGFGLVYVEAMRHGVPVIASIHDAAPEVNLHGITGFNVNLENPNELAERIIRVLTEPGDLGRNGLDRWAEHYRFSAFRRRFLSLFEEFLESHV